MFCGGPVFDDALGNALQGRVSSVRLMLPELLLDRIGTGAVRNPRLPVGVVRRPFRRWIGWIQGDGYPVTSFLNRKVDALQ
jgi:hypothetical protein